MRELCPRQQDPADCSTMLHNGTLQTVQASAPATTAGNQSLPIHNGRHTRAEMSLLLLGLITLLLHELDVLTGIRMIEAYGLSFELNPVARSIYSAGGSLALFAAKFGVVSAAVVLLLYLARAGRPRLARNCLFFASILGLLGLVSNLV